VTQLGYQYNFELVRIQEKEGATISCRHAPFASAGCCGVVVVVAVVAVVVVVVVVVVCCLLLLLLLFVVVIIVCYCLLLFVVVCCCGSVCSSVRMIIYHVGCADQVCKAHWRRVEGQLEQPTPQMRVQALDGLEVSMGPPKQEL